MGAEVSFYAFVLLGVLPHKLLNVVEKLGLRLWNVAGRVVQLTHILLLYVNLDGAFHAVLGPNDPVYLLINRGSFFGLPRYLLLVLNFFPFALDRLRQLPLK